MTRDDEEDRLNEEVRFHAIKVTRKSLATVRGLECGADAASKDRWVCHGNIARAAPTSSAAGGEETTPVFQAMMTMKKIEVAAIEAARRG